MFSQSSPVLYDTDFLIALFLEDQSTHEKAMNIFNEIRHREAIILNLVKFELATVLSHKFSQKLSVSVMEALQKHPIQTIILTEEEEAAVWETFIFQTKKGTSFVDCANLTMAKKLGFTIASFDKFYPNSILAGE